MLGYLAADEIFLDSHSIKDGFIIQESNDDIERAKALLIGTKKTELILESEPIEEDKKTQPTKSAALLFENFQVSYPQNMYLNDSSTLYLLLPSWRRVCTNRYKRTTANCAFTTEKMRIAKRTAPSLQLLFKRKDLAPTISSFRHKLKEKLPITIRTSINQDPKNPVRGSKGTTKSGGPNYLYQQEIALSAQIPMQSIDYYNMCIHISIPFLQYKIEWNVFRLFHNAGMRCSTAKNQ